MSVVKSRVTGKEFDPQEWLLRVDMAAAFRLAVNQNWHESVANHFSAAVSDDGKTFLLNPRWKHFAEIRASDLLKLNSDDDSTMHGPDAPDPSAWGIHGAIHARLPKARVILHCHPVYATTLCTLKDPSIKPIDQCTGRFFKRYSIDLELTGTADAAGEGERVAEALKQHSILMMGNHGVIVVAETVAEAFEDLYYLERACQTMVLAYSTGQPLNIMTDEVADNVESGWEKFRKGLAEGHFDYLKRTLDDSDPSYRD